MDDVKTSQTIINVPWWVAVIVILGAILTIVGAVVSKVMPTMLTDGSPVTEATRVYADYMFARNLPLAALLLLFLWLRSRQVLASLMLLTALIQLVDITNDLLRGAFILVPGLLVFAIVFLIGARRLLEQPIWRINTWRKRNSNVG